MRRTSCALGIVTSAVLLAAGLSGCGGGGGGGGNAPNDPGSPSDPGTPPPPAATITARSPDQDATGVGVASAVTVTFSGDMDASTLTSTSFRLSSETTPVAGTVTYASRVATFTPSSALAPGATYVVLLTTGVKDSNGNVVGGASWHFTTLHTGAKPVAPTGLVANALLAPNSISLSWAFNSTGADGFKIERSPDNTSAFAQIATVGPEARSYTDGGLDKCRVYYYRVKAYNAAGDSPAATPQSAGTDRDVTYDPTLVLTDPLTVSGTNITLNWSYTGTAPSPWSFTEWWIRPAGITSYNDACTDPTAPYSCSMNVGTEYGVHCFWVGPVNGCYSKPVCASVSAPTMGTLRVTNNSKFDIRRVDVGPNASSTTNLLAAGYIIPVGQSADFAVAPGSYYYKITSGNAANAFWQDSTGGPLLAVTAGNVTTVAYAVPTLPLLLTDFSGAPKVWRDYFLNCASNYDPEWATITFSPNGSWSSSANTNAPRSGTVTLVEWPDRSSQIKFKLCDTCEVITLNYGLTRSFYYANGPSCTGTPWIFRYSLVP